MDGHCEKGVCEGNICIISGPDERCNRPEDCGSGKCGGGVCKLGVGAGCTTGATCASGICTGTRCAAAGFGGSCIETGDSDCATGLYCGYGSCHVWEAATAGSSWAIGNWVPVAGAAVLVAYLIAGLAYMVGIGFQYKEVAAWANAEFWEASLSAMMVGLCFVLVLMMSDVSTVLSGSPDHIAEGWKYLDKVTGDLFADWGGLVLGAEGIGTAASFWIRMQIPIPIIPSIPMAYFTYLGLAAAGTPGGMSYDQMSGEFGGIGGAGVPGGTQMPDMYVFMPSTSPLTYPTTALYLRTGATLAFLSGWNQIVSGFGPLVYLTAIGMLATYAQRALLTFAGNNMLTLFLPLGLIARAFPLTRRMGGTLIAMALALYFVYPLALVMDMQIYEIGQSHLMATGLVANPNVQTTATGGGGVGWIVGLLRPLVEDVVAVMILFVLTLIITITGFRAIAVSIGGDPNIFGLGKMGA